MKPSPAEKVSDIWQPDPVLLGTHDQSFEIILVAPAASFFPPASMFQRAQT